MKKSDIIIIGSGPGGYNAALYAAKEGLTTTIIEKSDVGGTCLNRGCIPTKTLCRSAEVADETRNASAYGLNVSGAVSVDFGKVMERKRKVVEQLRSGVETLMQTPGITLVRGLARFKDTKTVIVGDEEYTADNIIIATGSTSKFPPIEGIKADGVMDSTELLEIGNVPRHLCVIGAGVIGMEFASIFNSFGSKVSVLEFLGECLPVLDKDIAKRLRQAMSKRGIDFSMRSAVKSITTVNQEDGTKKLSVSYERKGDILSVTADAVLVATGRKPNTDGLQLGNAGVEFSQQGITVDKDYMSTTPGIYAIGDVNGLCMLAHAASAQGQHVVNKILGKADDIRFHIMPSAIFTYPEAASVGMSEEQLKSGGVQYICRKGYYRSNGKALAMDKTDGLLKLFADATNGKIIGCHAYGAHASDIVQEVSSLMCRCTTLGQLGEMIHIHPTLSEILKETAGLH